MLSSLCLYWVMADQFGSQLFGIVQEIARTGSQRLWRNSAISVEIVFIVNRGLCFFCFFVLPQLLRSVALPHSLSVVYRHWLYVDV